MLRTLFLILWTIPFMASLAEGDIEIYANGHKYNSIQAYVAAKKLAASRPAPTPVPLKGNMSDATLHKLYVLSVENGVVGALQDFYQNVGHSDFQITHQISSDQLQEAIQQAVTTSKDPKLLIAEPGKMRIMGLKS